MTTRRQFIRGAGAASLFFSAPAIIRPASAQAPPPRLRSADLPTPDFPALQPSIERIACIRPHRKGGVRLSLEKFDNTTRPRYIIHNYGHSGAGITLSFGCASVVVDYVETVMNLRRRVGPTTTVAILGSGVIGLTTATELRRKWPGLPITIYAKAPANATAPDVVHTTSYKAGGQFEPSVIADEYRRSNRAVLTAYLRASAKRIKEIEASGKAASFGIAARKNYAFDDPNLGFDEFIPPDVVPSYKLGTLPFKAMTNADGSRMIGREYSTWLINPRILLPKLAADLAARNVAFRPRTFSNQQDVASLSENVIINCTGLGAATLFNDPDMVPKRGLLLRIPLAKPSFNYFFSGGCQNNKISYMFGRQTDLVIGGTVKDNEDSETISDRDRIVCGHIFDNIGKVFAGKSNECVDLNPLISWQLPQSPVSGTVN